MVEAERIERVAGQRPIGPDFTYSVLPREPAVRGERRRASRQKTRLRSGKIVGLDGRFISECVIQNRSASGGRVRLPAAIAPPPCFLFYDDQTEQLFDAALKWRKERDLGLILTPCPPTPPNRAIAGRMRRKFYRLGR